jgi:hypothetical protein
MKVRFLIDEDLSLEYVRALQRYDPKVDVLRIGMPEAPAFSTLDPDVLLYCEQAQRALVTENRATMPGHEASHFAAGRHHWGIFKLRKGHGFGAYLAELQLIWDASEAEEWHDQSRWLPL